MTYLGINDINALGDKTKLLFSTVDPDLESSVALEIFSQVGQVHDTTIWLSPTTTPKLVLKILAMFYVGWYYERVYSEDDAPNNYGLLLVARGQRLIDGIIAGTVELIDITVPAKNNEQPDFYPTDASSLLLPTFEDPSLGGPAFTMGKIW